MEKVEELRRIVAEVADVAVAQVGSDFSLAHPRLRQSLGLARLDARIRGQFGVRIPALRKFNTFNELALALAAANSHESTLLPAAVPPPVPVGEDRTKLVTHGQPRGLLCGIDLERIDQIPKLGDPSSAPFIHDHFTEAEISWCSHQGDPQPHLAGRWCAKEALRKAVPEWLEVPMNQISVAPGTTGAPRLVWHKPAGVTQNIPVTVSISHTQEFAVAVVIGGAESVRLATAAPKAMAGNEFLGTQATRALTLAWIALIVALLALVGLIVRAT